MSDFLDGAVAFAPGDKVMQIENDYDKDVYNGDTGYPEDVDPQAGELTSGFDDPTVAYAFGGTPCFPRTSPPFTRARARSILPSSSPC